MLAANKRQAPNLTNPGNTAAQLVAQTPPTQSVADLSRAIPGATGANIIAQIQQSIARGEAQERQMNLIRTLGEQGAFNGGNKTKGTP